MTWEALDRLAPGTRVEFYHENHVDHGDKGTVFLNDSRNSYKYILWDDGTATLPPSKQLRYVRRIK